MQQPARLPLWFLVANWALIGASFVLGAMLAGGRGDLVEPQGSALAAVYREILKSHVDPQDGHVLLDRAIGRMVDGLDAYSKYVPPSEVKRYDEDSTGRYEGIGIVPHTTPDAIVVLYPLADGPADRAGILPGDRIVAIDGAAVASLPAGDRDAAALERIRGPADTELLLRLDRGGRELELTVRREAVQKPSVKWVHVVDEAAGLGYVHVADFHAGVAAQFTAAVDALQAHAPLRGLIVDLRFDLGGNFDECVAIARALLPKGTIVTTQRRGEVLERTEAKPELCRYPHLPLVLLLNETSASASEVLAGALQDNGRAAVVGVRSYGKGFVNTAYTFRDFRLKLTTAHYFTPSGRSIERRRPPPGAAGNGRAPGGDNGPPEDRGGIVPDVAEPISAELGAAIGRRLERHEVPARHRAAYDRVAAEYGLRVPAPPQVADDPQLARSVAVLRDRIVAATATEEPPKKD
jgi:carboxyl-terminal processing protease